MTSFTIHALGAVLLVQLSGAAPDVLKSPVRVYERTELVAPVDPPRRETVREALVAPPVPKVERPIIEPPVVAAERQLPPVPLPPAPQPQQTFEAKPTAAAPSPQVVTGQFASAAPAVPVAGEKQAPVQVGGFSGSSAAPTLANKSPREVQTGGFGDPNGARPDPNARAGKLTMAAVGSFDLPSGGGQGNGSGGTRGAAGTVASAGFGNGVATRTPGSGLGRGGAVREGGFGDASAGAGGGGSGVRARPVAPVAATTAAEVLSKPTPAYTEEARKNKIEGTVLLEVIFTADGRVQVVRVVRGLGHGLDQAAIAAAERIQFKPATRNGQPVDSTARIHIVFQTA